MLELEENLKFLNELKNKLEEIKDFQNKYMQQHKLQFHKLMFLLCLSPTPSS